MAGVTPIGRDAHHDTPLANVAIKAFQSTDEFIAQKLFPVVRVGKQSDRYYVIDKDAWLRVPNTRRAPKTAPVLVEFQVSSNAYFCDNYAAATDLAKEDIATADDALDLRNTAAEYVTELILRDYEVRVAQMVTSGSNLGSYVSLSTKWSDYNNSDPIADVNTGHAFIRSQTGLRANTLVLDEDTYNTVRRHPMLLDLYKYTAGGQLNEQQLKDAFSVENILVGKGVWNQANYGATASITNIWGNNAILAYVKPGLTMRTATFGLSFRWQPPGFPLPMQAFRYDDPHPGKKVEYVEVGMFQDEKIIAQQLSYGILNTL